ncbi:MAG: transporter [Prevotella sp.]|nr:transporter [Prevotella sp.]
MNLLSFLKNWTLPVAIAVGSVCYLVFLWVPALDELGNLLGPIIDFIFPLSVFGTLFVTFCKVDFRQMRPHRWHVGVLVVQLLLVAIVVGTILGLHVEGSQKLLLEALLTCVIAPSASAAPVVTGKLGGNISTMSAFTVISAFASSLMIPFVFPMLEQTVHTDFWSAFAIILQKVAIVLLLPLAMGYLMQRFARVWEPVERFHRAIVGMPNLSFYCWAFSLSITSGITVKNIVHSGAGSSLLILIALLTLLLCFVQFALGRGIGKRLGEHINCGQALFQKNTALAIWVAYMYLNPVASVGAGCYVLWQNIINSVELWAYRKKHS